jgi:hypothetical protein
MRAYKFLDSAGRAPFTSTPWTTGEWVETASAHPCVEGVHACRPADVAHWLAATMWEVELDGQIVESRHKVVASRGRIVAAVDGYDAAARELAAVGAWRARDRAVDALGAAGARPAAERFAEATSLDELVSCGDVVGTGVDESTFAGVAAGLAADAAYFALHGDRAQSPFVAACSAGHDAAGPDGDQAAYDTGFAAERAFQSAWLTERLGLA